MVEVTSSIPGALVEDNLYSISVHYRNCSESDIRKIEQLTEQELSPFTSELVRKEGKCLYEIRPSIDWHKGHAVSWLLSTLFPNSDNVVPMYLGDDITD